MKTVLVVGTKGDQPRRLRDRLRGLAELICIPAEELSRKKIPKADLVVLWCKFMSHKSRDLIYGEVERDKIMLHFGGVTELAETIAQLVRTDVAATIRQRSQPGRCAKTQDHLALAV
jgi:hypothetical protein